MGTLQQPPAWLDDIPVNVDAAIIGPMIRVSEVLALHVGSVIATGRLGGENIDVFAGGARIGSGEFSAIGQRSRLRLVKLGG